MNVRYRQFFLCVLITALLVAAWAGTGLLKKGYHVDEIFTFILSNHQYKKGQSSHSITVTDGKIYRGNDIWKKFLSVEKNKRFDYANVFVNQSKNVHPPLYYVLVHTVCSIAPTWSIRRVGLVVNIMLACVIFWQMVWLARRLSVGKGLALTLSVCYVLGTGFIGFAIVFFRMYCLMSIWVCALVMVFFAYPPEEKATTRYCLALGLVLMGGAMTQYYFLIYAFLTCALYATFVLRAHNWNKLVWSAAVSSAIAVVTVKIYPALIYHVFTGNRGKQALHSNDMFTSFFQHKLWNLLDQTNRYTYGSLFAIVLTIAICLLMVAPKDRLKEDLKNLYRYMLLLLPSCAYLLITSLIAPFQTMRYWIAVSGLHYLGLMCGIACLGRTFSRKSGYAVAILAVLLSFWGYNRGVPNLYLSTPNNIKKLQKHPNSLCLNLYEDRNQWKCSNHLPLLKDRNEIIFINERDWNKYKKTDYNRNSMIVFLSQKLKSKHTTILNEIKQQNHFESWKELFKEGYSTVYYLEKDPNTITARIDIFNFGADTNGIELVDITDTSASVRSMSWVKSGGSGKFIESADGKLTARLRCIGDGKLKIDLRGRDVRSKDGKRIPYWIDYTSFIVNGTTTFDGDKNVWHDKPHTLSFEVKDNDIIEISATWRPASKTDIKD